MPEVLRGVVRTRTGGEAAIDGLIKLIGTPPAWDRVLEGPQPPGDVIVPLMESWLVGAGVQIAGNLLVDGRAAMRPGSGLKFLGADPTQYVGGGLDFDSALHANDIGLWIRTTGVLDIQGTPKVGWNRTGIDPSWLIDDEYWIAPTDVGDFTPRRWSPGDAVPRVPLPQDAVMPWLDPDWQANGVPAEVMNVTRDIVIEGPGHIHIRSELPQIIKYVTLRGLGVRQAAGRFVIHFHRKADGTRGSIVEGVVAIDSRGIVYVPHESHGITMRDVVSLNSTDDVLWWNKGDETNDLLVDRLCVSGVTGTTGAANLRVGTSMTMKGSAISGSQGGKAATGFFWESGGKPPQLWDFTEGNVAHNNVGFGLRFWSNTRAAHHPRNTLSYRNKNGGIENGAYGNSNRWTDILLVGNGITHRTNSRFQELDNGPGRYERVYVDAGEGPAVLCKNRNFEAENYWEFIDCVLLGTPKVDVQAGKLLWLALFRRCDMVPDDVVFDLTDPNLEGSHVIIEHEDGRIWHINITGGQKVVTQR